MTEIRLEKSLPSEQERVGQPSVPAEGLERYFAREGVDPLPYAFEGKIAVHPGLGGSGVEKQDFEATLEPLLAEPRTGKTVAYIHVPFCETHCLYCGFYNKAYRVPQFADELPLVTGNHIHMAAGIGVGIDALAGLILSQLFGQPVTMQLLIPYSEGSLVHAIS